MELPRGVRRCASIVGMIALGLTAFAAPAHAEGSWSGSVSGVRQGFESRRWTDRDNDANDTIVSFSDCTYTFQGNEMDGNNVDIELWRDISYAPDRGQGKQKLYCNWSGSGNWGHVGAGEYYFAIYLVNGWNDWKVSAKPVSASY